MIFPADPETIGRLYAAWALRAGQPDSSPSDVAVFRAIKAAIRLGPDENVRFHRAIDEAVREHFPDQSRADARRAWGTVHRIAVGRIQLRAPRRNGTPSPRQRSKRSR